MATSVPAPAAAAVDPGQPHPRDLAPDALRRQRHLVGDHLYLRQGRAGQGAARRRDLRPRRAGAPVAGALAGREPVTGVLPIAGIADRYHRFAVDGVPVDRVGRRRRRLGLYRPVGRARDQLGIITPRCSGSSSAAAWLTRRASRRRGMRAPNGRWPRSTTTSSAPTASAWPSRRLHRPSLVTAGHAESPADQRRRLGPRRVPRLPAP